MEAKSLVEHFSEIEDPRRAGYAHRHDLVEILVIAVCAMCSDVEGFEEMEDWALAKEPWLRRFLKLDNGIASHDTFRRVFALLDPQAFEKAFRAWVASVLGAFDQVAIDGKALRGSADADNGPLHMVSAFATELGLVLGQEAVADKSNEIVCHERNRRQFGGRGVSPEMRAGPSKSAYRSRFQTATSCVGKEPSW